MMNKEIIKENFYSLGTDIEMQIAVSGDDEKKKAKGDIREAWDIYRKQEKIFSRFDKESELSKINNNLGKFIEVSEDMLEVAGKAVYFYDFSEGIFDPRIIDVLERAGYDKDFKSINASEVDLEKLKLERVENDLKEELIIKEGKVCFRRKMDFSGIAKGYITDKASEFLKSKGWKNFLVNSGGDIFCKGTDEKEKKWGILLEDSGSMNIAVRLSEKGIATSGITRRKWNTKSGGKAHHLINPKNPGKFDFELKSATSIARNALEADVIAKILFLMGRSYGMEFAEKNKIGAIFVDYRGNVYISSEAKNNLKI